MNRILRLYLEEGTLVVAVRAFIDVRLPGEEEPLVGLIEDGLRALARQGPYQLPEGEVPVRVDVTRAERFSLDALNIRVYDKTPVIRGPLNPRVNVSRAYFFSGWPGLFKLERYLLRFPDIFINLGGRDISSEAGYGLMRSVVQHEFGHVLGFKDQYRGKKGVKRSAKVENRDLMYRTGVSQHFMEYHIRRLYECAAKGKLPVRRV